MGYRRSSVPNLYRDERTGIYYVRTKVHGRTIWKTLQTNEFRVAKLRAPKELGDLQKGRNALSSLERGSATFGSLAELYRTRIQSDTRLKPSSRIYRCQTIDAILRFRPEWIEKLVRDIRETDCLRWAAAYSGKVHGTRFNNTVGTLRAIFQVGLENGLLADNPARSIRKVRVSGKSLRSPSAEQFADILGNIESSGAWCAHDAADLVRFLAYSGCRINEAANVKPDDVDLQAGTIRISGDPVHGTKNSESRVLPVKRMPSRHLACRLRMKFSNRDRGLTISRRGY